ncbi:MAG: hypothetical protein HZA52_16130, partial [Planctomycetes bacterium]|nr:hypothetical protein [Planctomycetota bacterium]
AVLDDGVVWCSLGYRYYRELDPPSAIERADLDEQSYFAASLDFPQGWFLRYSTGTLPIDARDDSAFELGWSHSF